MPLKSFANSAPISHHLVKNSFSIAVMAKPLKTSKLKCISFGFTLLMLILSATLHAQMVGINAYIKGDNAELGIDGNGGFEGCPTVISPPLPGMHFRSDNDFFGFTANTTGGNWTQFDGDFFTPGTEENGWGFEIGNNGTYASNNCYDLDLNGGIPGAITEWTQIADCISLTWEGDRTVGTNLHFKVNYLLHLPDRYYTTTVSITNNTSSTIPTLYYYRNVDPDNNVSLCGYSTTSCYYTQNTIEEQPIIGGGCSIAHVSATQATPWLSYIAFAAAGDNWKAGYGGFSNRDASDLWNGTGFVQTSGSTHYDDEAIYIANRIQNLAPGATESFKFVVILDDALASIAVGSLMHISYPGSSNLPPSICNATIDTATVCAGSPAPISVSLGSSSSNNVLNNYTWVWSPAAGLNTATGPSVIASPSVTTTYTVNGTPNFTNCGPPVNLSVVVKVAAAPTVTVPNSISTCAGTLIPATAFSSNQSGTTFIWTNSNPAIGLAASDTGNVPAFVPTNTTSSPITSTIEVTPVIGGCNGTPSTYTITVAPSTGITVNSPTICAGQSTVITAVGGTNYSWNTGGSNDTLVVTPTTTTTYTVTGTDSSGCVVSSDAVVTVISLQLAITSTPVCAGQTATLVATGANFYQWNSGATNDTIMITPTATATYSVTGTDANGCTANFSTTLVVNSNPVVTVNSPTICSGQSVTLTANGGDTYTWNSIAAPDTFVVSPTSSTSYTVIGTDTNGCVDTAVSNVIVNISPVSNAGQNVTICSGLSTQLMATGGGSYSWSPSTGLSNSSISNPILTPTATTTYTVTVTSANNCTDSDDVLINVLQSPTANFTAAPVCFNDPTVFTNLSSGGATNWNWSFGDGNNSTLQSPSYTYTAPGNYTSNLIVSGSNGCSDTLALPVIVYAVPELPQLTSNSPICEGNVFNINTIQNNTYNYNWTGPDNFSSTEQNIIITNSAVSMSGTYTLITSIPSTNCTSPMASINIEVLSSPAIPDITTSTQLCYGDTLSLNTTAAASNYLWNGPNGFTSELQNPSITNFNDDAVGDFTLTIENSNGCTSQNTVAVALECEDILALFIPNVFTPNGDGENQTFRVITADVKEIEVFIYNRWGILVYSYNSLDGGWDGKTDKGSVAPDGTYFYIVNATTYRGRAISQKGTFTLLK
jgi:gliding motility-associated-like protein